MNDEELTKLAEEELLKEAQRAAARAEIIGPEGWRKCPSRNVNKRFLVSTIRDAVYTNKRVKLNHKNVYYRDKTKRLTSTTSSPRSESSPSPPIPSHRRNRSDEEDDSNHKYVDSYKKSHKYKDSKSKNDSKRNRREERP